MEQIVMRFVGSFLRTPRTYENVRESADEVIARHLTFLREAQIKVTDFMPKSRYVDGADGKRVPPAPTLAHPMASAKFHKIPMGWRFIACSSTYTLRALSMWLGRAFKALLPVADAMWIARLDSVGVRSDGSWILRDSRGIPPMIQEMNNTIAPAQRAGARLQTFDFAKMYTNIRLDVLKGRMRRLFENLFTFQRESYHRHRFLRVSTATDKAKWLSVRTQDTDAHKVFGWEKLARWFEYLVDNTYLSFGTDMVLRQRIGIPMGTNCAVFVANLFCYTYEFDFVAQLVRLRLIALLRAFKFTKRFVDDLFSGAHARFADYLYRSQVDADGVRGIYPDFLRLTREQDSESCVSFLDMYIRYDGRSWYTEVYDKREHPPLSRVPPLKYPHPSCFISERAQYGIITSQLHRFGHICVRKVDFIKRARMFLNEFHDRGYNRRRMKRVVMSFLKRVALHFAVFGIPAFAESLLP